MGYNIGLRLADDLLAKNPQVQRCTDMHQVADVLAKTALRSYLGEIIRPVKLCFLLEKVSWTNHVRAYFSLSLFVSTTEPI